MDCSAITDVQPIEGYTREQYSELQTKWKKIESTSFLAWFILSGIGAVLLVQQVIKHAEVPRTWRHIIPGCTSAGLGLAAIILSSVAFERSYGYGKLAESAN